MKKTLLTICLTICSIALFSQVSIKEATLGSTVKVNEKTTITGEEYYLKTYHLNSGKCWQISAIPCKGEKTRRVGSAEIAILLKALEQKFSIDLKFHSTSKYNLSGYYKAKKDGVEFFIMTKHNKYNDLPYTLSLAIIDLKLEQIHKVEKQTKANLDI